MGVDTTIIGEYKLIDHWEFFGQSYIKNQTFNALITPKLRRYGVQNVIREKKEPESIEDQYSKITKIYIEVHKPDIVTYTYPEEINKVVEKFEERVSIEEYVDVINYLPVLFFKNIVSLSKEESDFLKEKGILDLRYIFLITQ